VKSMRILEHYEVAISVAMALLMVTLTGLLLNIGFHDPVFV
jgi:hypothetical protein